MQEEPKHRLKIARERAGFKTPAEAARHLKIINQNTLTSNENGNRALSRQYAEKYAKAFSVDAGWLLYGEEGTPNPLDIPVVSMISAGNLMEQETITEKDIHRWVTVSDLPNGDWLAFEVYGDSMDRIAPNESLLLVDKANTMLIERCFYIFIEPETGNATFKQYRANPARMQPYSINPDHMATKLTNEIIVFARVKRVIIDL